MSGIGACDICAGALVLLSDGELSVSDVCRLCVAGQGGHERREKSEGGHEHCALLCCDLVSAVVGIDEGVVETSVDGRS